MSTATPNLLINGHSYRSLRFFPAWNENCPQQIHGIMHLAQDIHENAKNNKTWVEIGTFNGESATIFLGFKYINKFHCVDCNKNEFAENRLKKYVSSGRCVMHLKSSLQASLEIEKADVVYIDGNHEYESVKSDIETWWPKISEGGVLAGHDYSKLWLGTVQAVDEFRKTQPLLTFKTYEDSSWAIFK